MTGQRLRQPAGMRWSAAVDPAVAALVAGCDGTRTLGELAAVLAVAFGIEPGQVAEMARGLADRGFLSPYWICRVMTVSSTELWRSRSGGGGGAVASGRRPASARPRHRNGAL